MPSVLLYQFVFTTVYRLHTFTVEQSLAPAKTMFRASVRLEDIFNRQQQLCGCWSIGT
jgi:hypothetical protein